MEEARVSPGLPSDREWERTEEEAVYCQRALGEVRVCCTVNAVIDFLVMCMCSHLCSRSPQK